MKVPAISALLERCFSHERIILKPERDCLLRKKFDELLFLKINTSELIFSDVINIFIQYHDTILAFGCTGMNSLVNLVFLMYLILYLKAIIITS